MTGKTKTEVVSDRKQPGLRCGLHDLEVRVTIMFIPNYGFPSDCI
jgi:hypothetical protein